MFSWRKRRNHHQLLLLMRPLHAIITAPVDAD
jgi:hypothetical protein